MAQGTQRLDDSLGNGRHRDRRAIAAISGRREGEAGVGQSAFGEPAGALLPRDVEVAVSAQPPAGTAATPSTPRNVNKMLERCLRPRGVYSPLQVRCPGLGHVEVFL